MPPKRNVGKVAQTLQIGLGEGSPAHSEGENEPIIPPPLSLILGEHYFVNPTFNKDSESGDDVAQSSDSLVKVVSDQISIIRHTLLESKEKAQQRSQEVARQLDESFQNLAQNLAQSVADMRRSNEKSARIWREQIAENWRAFQAETERMQEAFRHARIDPQPQAADLQRQNQNIPSLALGGQNSVYTWRQMEDLFHIQFYRSEPKVSMADLSRLVQRPGETSEAFLTRFWKARLKCIFALPEQKFVKLAQNGLDIELRKKFEGMEFRDFFELSYKVGCYENLLREDTQRKSASHGTYYGDANFDLDVVEVVANKLVVCSDLVKVVQQTVKTIKRYVEEAGKQYTFDISKTNEIFDHLKKNKIDKGILCFPNKAKETMGVDANPFPTMSVGVNAADLMSIARDRTQTYYRRRLATDDLREQSESAVCHKTDLTEEEEVIEIPTKSESAVNGGRTEVVTADDKPFVANTNAVEARYYDEDIGTICFFGMDRYGRLSRITACTRSAVDRQTVKEKDRIKHQKKEAVEEIKRKLATYLAEKRIYVDKSEVVYEGEEEDLKDQITLEELDLALAKLDDLKAEVQDPLEEVNLGLDKNLVEHRLPIREDFKPFKQSPRRMSPEVTLKVKEEIERLLKVGFIRTSKYVKWLSNVVPVVKKSGNTPPILSFMDGHNGYNQIFIVKKDIPKIAFRCPGAIVHERGLEVDQNKARAVIEAQPPKKIGKWVLALSEFNLKYMPQKAVKRQTLADFLVDHPCLEVEADEEKCINLFSISLVPWKLIFDGSSTDSMSIAGIVIISPTSLKTQMSFQLDFNCTNNQAEYEASIIRLEVLVELKVPVVEIIGDSQLMLKQLEEANEMAQIASGLKIPEDVMSRIVVVQKRILPSINMRDEYCQIMSDVHSGICGAHQAGIKMRWLIRRHGFFWPSILKDCISYAKGCVVDLINKVYPPSTRGHSFIIVATDYFTKWVEAKPMKKVDQIDIIKFLKEEIIHRFGLPETVALDRGTVFVGARVEAFAKEMGFRLLTSTPHYAQANGQAKAFNRIVINLLEKMVDDNPRSLRIAIQHSLTSGEYNEVMILELEDLEEGDLVWKVILPPGKKDPRFGKWSPNWEGPFHIHEVLRRGAYWLESLNGELHPQKINGIYLNPYYPMIWEARVWIPLILPKTDLRPNLAVNNHNGQISTMTDFNLY
ncbi:hypothetical protein SLEP1_g13330 [Rubroshorea leprosula]|uniref:Integrase catalytic domain-containing protein n=1 Tax=Rubroshorea leprosula TaxID=152421 RepID=A0AAV5IQV4_9ROSI|nr:hypothetical protein SLEP1_g13330 [Rubroshorea leprosula]